MSSSGWENPNSGLNCETVSVLTAILVHPLDGDGDIVFGVNGLRKFGGVYREKGAPRPHQYLQQRISNPASHLGEARNGYSQLPERTNAAQKRGGMADGAVFSGMSSNPRQISGCLTASRIIHNCASRSASHLVIRRLQRL
jgi:hypothetical protein